MNKKGLEGILALLILLIAGQVGISYLMFSPEFIRTPGNAKHPQII